jgi:hypothetical protein
MASPHVSIPAPYAPLSNVLTVIRRLRDRGLPDILSPQELARLGIPDGNIGRTLQALRFLGLIDEDGRRTEAFTRLGRVAAVEYPAVLGSIVEAAYTPVFTIVNPSEATELQIFDAFRCYQPEAQRARMISLFLGLCREAGLIPGAPNERRPRTRRPLDSKRPSAGARPGNAVHEQSVPPLDDSRGDQAPDYQLVQALVHQLPKHGRWTAARRDRWIQALIANVDLLVDITEEPSVSVERPTKDVEEQASETSLA